MTVSCHVVITNGNATSFDFEEVLRLATTYCYRVVKVFPQFYFHVDRVVFAVVGFGPQNDAIVVSRKS